MSHDGIETTRDRQPLDRLMCRTVLAAAHRVVGEDEHRRQLHQRGEPDRGARIVAEDEERRPALGPLKDLERLLDAQVELVVVERAGPLEREGGLSWGKHLERLECPSPLEKLARCGDRLRPLIDISALDGPLAWRPQARHGRREHQQRPIVSIASCMCPQRQRRRPPPREAPPLGR
jgi:hypothetical protein